MLRKVDRYRPEDPLLQSAWHKARLDLQGFMRQHKTKLSLETVQSARELHGPFDQHKHPYPSWSLKRGWYVEMIYGFIVDCIREMNEQDEKRIAA